MQNAKLPTQKAASCGFSRFAGLRGWEAGLILLVEGFAVGLGDIVPAGMADGAFETGEHGAAGRVVRAELGDAEGGFDGTELFQVRGGGDAGGGEEARDLGANVGKVSEGGCFSGRGFHGFCSHKD
jgi:hypothetical protein